MIPTTEVVQDIGLKIPIYDGSYKDGKGRFLSEPEIVKNSLLELMFEPEELESLVLVKIDSKNPDPKHLRSRTFDGVQRKLAFSSGNNYYFADDEIPCGEYEFPISALGNRGNAKVTNYDNSWQFSIWYSEEALRKDFALSTQFEAEELAKLQRNPLTLAKHIVKEYDLKQQRAREHAELSVDDDSLERENTDKNQEQQELRLVTLLRNDKFGLLLVSNCL